MPTLPPHAPGRALLAPAGMPLSLRLATSARPRVVQFSVRYQY